jgi:hypothetical protein
MIWRTAVPNQKKMTHNTKRFIKTARVLECDEEKERFEAKLGQIAKAKPAPKPKPEK